MVYEIFDFDKLETVDDLFNKQYGGHWKRFEIDLENDSVISKDLYDLPDGGNVELPSFNKKYDGVKENCFTYLIEFFSHQEILDYGFDLIKFDSCKNKVAGRWAQPYYLPN